ncbi:MAG: hypothetical protein ACRCTJ_06785 [Brevinema sp.]
MIKILIIMTAIVMSLSFCAKSEDLNKKSVPKIITEAPIKNVAPVSSSLEDALAFGKSVSSIALEGFNYIEFNYRTRPSGFGISGMTSRNIQEQTLIEYGDLDKEERFVSNMFQSLKQTIENLPLTQIGDMNIKHMITEGVKLFKQTPYIDNFTIQYDNNKTTRWHTQLYIDLPKNSDNGIYLKLSTDYVKGITDLGNKITENFLGKSLRQTVEVAKIQKLSGYIYIQNFEGSKILLPQGFIVYVSTNVSYNQRIFNDENQNYEWYMQWTQKFTDPSGYDLAVYNSMKDQNVDYTMLVKEIGNKLIIIPAIRYASDLIVIRYPINQLSSIGVNTKSEDDRIYVYEKK